MKGVKGRTISERASETKRPTLVPCTVYLTASYWEELSKAAAELEISRNKLITLVMESFLEEREAKGRKRVASAPKG